MMTLHLGNSIAGLDFNPAGESIATIDSIGVCLISDVSTDKYVFHLEIGDKPGNTEFQKHSSQLQFSIVFAFLTTLMITIAYSHSYNRSLDYYGRCRWGADAGEPFLFVKYDINKLNILDGEKKALILSNPIQLDARNGTNY